LPIHGKTVALAISIEDVRADAKFSGVGT
jgi:hypothetical protein